MFFAWHFNDVFDWTDGCFQHFKIQRDLRGPNIYTTICNAKKLVDFPKKTVSNCLFVFNGGVPVGMVPEPLTLQLFVNDQKKTLSSLLSIEAYHPMLPTIPQISPQKLWRAFWSWSCCPHVTRYFAVGPHKLWYCNFQNDADKVKFITMVLILHVYLFGAFLGVMG